MGQAMLQLLREDGSVVRDLVPPLAPDAILNLYRHMLLSRRLDVRMQSLQRQGRIGFYGTSTGEEAAVVGSALALEPQDWILPALRQGAAVLLRGMPLDLYIAQVIGNSLDVQKGRQMPCHYSWKDGNFVAWSSCIGTQLPHAVGVALAAKYRRQPVVALAYMGDGATSEPDFHAAMNFAAVWKVPVVFLCQNNQWAISVPLAKQTASETIAVKAVAYGMPGVRVDGNDPLAVYGATREAVERARGGQGPTLIEAVTYRMGAHSTSDDPKRYRTEEETEAWARRDPIDRLRRYLEAQGLWDGRREEALVAELDGLIQASLQRVEGAPPPPLESMVEDVYAAMTPLLSEELEELRRRGRGHAGR